MRHESDSLLACAPAPSGSPAPYDGEPFYYEDLIGCKFEYYAKGPDRWDCWTLAQELARRQGKKLPDQETIVEAAARHARILQIFDSFELITRPERGCLVLFWIDEPDVLRHIGTMVDENRFIHVMESIKVAVSRLTSPFWRIRLHGLYRY